MQGWGIAQDILRILRPLILSGIEGKLRGNQANERKEALHKLLVTSPQATSQSNHKHNSLVGYLVTTDKTPEAQTFMEKAKEKVKEYIDTKEIEEVKYDEFKEKFPDVEISSVPTLVIWSSKTESPLAIIPFYKPKGKKKELKLATKEVGEQIAEEIEEEEEKELAKV